MLRTVLLSVMGLAIIAALVFVRLDGFSLGESYSPLILVLPLARRIYQCPAELFDAMIFAADAGPAKILPAQ